MKSILYLGILGQLLFTGCSRHTLPEIVRTVSYTNAGTEPVYANLSKNPYSGIIRVGINPGKTGLIPVTIPTQQENVSIPLENEYNEKVATLIIKR